MAKLNDGSRVYGTLTIDTTTFHNGNVVLGNSSVTVGVQANGSYGTAGQVLTSNGTATYWAAASGSGITTGKAIAMTLVFGG